ncbi:ABC transporter permease [Polynucleobacter sp. UK-Kesae-W10]|uniref:ABC transporter permease n=1 Tax=Polynucleobacter sp. UK-Kesae-W10 TaxID=1819738 RepID=UPI001C0B3114|nr:ABC transporter permease [Polynucleobacter sp. UK-Kesae-W10]MBU3576949.1 ABC transporter permease [Polynucleobacter sp. UK-Kesae-W10]
MQIFPTSPKEMVLSFWKNRLLIKSLVMREVQGRYRGSFGGIFWSIFNPIILLLIYTFVFSEIFKSRWEGGGDSRTEFALVLFAGLIAFNFFTECFLRAPGLILSNVNYVKKVIFPLEILPWVSIGSSIFHAIISFIVWLAAYFILFGLPPYSIFWVPIIILPLIFFSVGVGWIFASLGVYIRDISQAVGIITTVLMFITPIFYPITAIPFQYRFFLEFNPLAYEVQQLRGVMYWGDTPDLNSFSIWLFLSFSFACIGFFWFQKTRKGFADVL